MLSTSPPKLTNSDNGKGSSTFGIIAICISVIAFFTPRLFLSMILVGIAIFGIIGLVRDSSKIWSIIALFVGGSIIYSESMRVASGSELFDVTYLVSCANCEIRYTNETGGEDKIDCENCAFDKTVKLKGDQYTILSAMGQGDNNTSVEASIFVNGSRIKHEQASGDRSYVSLYCWPKEVKGY